MGSGRFGPDDQDPTSPRHSSQRLLARDRSAPGGAEPPRRGATLTRINLLDGRRKESFTNYTGRPCPTGTLSSFSPTEILRRPTMNEINPSSPARGPVSPRRLVLMGSVASIALAVLLGGPSGFRQVPLPSWSNQAQAADTTLQHPADFADLIAKVKPAVMSVRVKMDQGFQSSGSSDNENANP